MSGYLDDLVTMIPFCTESSSPGSPSRFHSPMVAWSTKNWVSWRSSDTGISFWTKSVWKYSSSNLVLNSELNGPQYDTKAQALATSPASLCFNDLNSAAFCTHLSLLSYKELISLFACSIFFLVLFAFSWRAFFSAICPSYLALRRAWRA